MIELSTESWAQRRDDWEKLLFELFNERVYIGFSSELGLPEDTSWLGVFLPSADLLIREACPQRFDGRRHTIVLNDSIFGDVDLTTPQVDFDSLVAHEFGHAIQGPVPDQKPAETVSLRRVAGVRKILSLRRADEPSADNSVPEWHYHGDDFIRILLHASRRLAAAGVELDDSEMFANSRYSLSPLAWYRHALGSEPADRASLPMRLGVDGDPPEAFTQLWRDDLRRHTPEARQARCEIRAATLAEEQALHIFGRRVLPATSCGLDLSSEEPSSEQM